MTDWGLIKFWGMGITRESGGNCLLPLPPSGYMMISFTTSPSKRLMVR